MFLFEEKRPQYDTKEVRKGAVLMDGVTVSVVKTKQGALFKERNYLELSHPSRNLLGK